MLLPSDVLATPSKPFEIRFFSGMNVLAFTESKGQIIYHVFKDILY